MLSDFASLLSFKTSRPCSAWARAVAGSTFDCADTERPFAGDADGLTVVGLSSRAAERPLAIIGCLTSSSLTRFVPNDSFLLVVLLVVVAEYVFSV